MSSFVVWLPRRTWWASKRRLEGPCACLPGLGTTSSPSSPAIDRVCVLRLVTWHSSVLLVVVVSDDGRCVSPCRHVLSASSLRCGCFIVLDGRGDGWPHRWWWWEGRSGVAMFEPHMPYLGGQAPRVGCIYLLLYVYHMDLSMESMVDMPKFHMESSGIQVEERWIPYGIDHSMTIP